MGLYIVLSSAYLSAFILLNFSTTIAAGVAWRMLIMDTW